MPRATSLGDRIRMARLNRRLTLGQVAEKVGISVSALSQLERDQFNPTIATLKAIATTLDTTIGSLVAEGLRGALSGGFTDEQEKAFRERATEILKGGVEKIDDHSMHKHYLVRLKTSLPV